jgi:hypothetical protein
MTEPTGEHPLQSYYVTRVIVTFTSRHGHPSLVMLVMRRASLPSYSILSSRFTKFTFFVHIGIVGSFTDNLLRSPVFHHVRRREWAANG